MLISRWLSHDISSPCDATLPLSEWLVDNIEMDDKERRLAVHAVYQGCTYFGGGGAARKWAIAPAAPQQTQARHAQAKAARSDG